MSLPRAVDCTGDAHGTATDRLAVLRAAGEVEADLGRVLAWYRETPIAQLGACTAHELVALGRAADVVAFLRSVANER